VLRERFGGPLKALSDFSVLNRLLGRQRHAGSGAAELLAVDSDFLTRLIDLGREDAKKA
jgi:hypothetical protein